jgi:putative N6-adenine-specific DNA methylase
LDQLFAVTAPGVATYTAQELRQLGLLPAASAGRRARQRSAQRSTQRAAPHSGERELQGGVPFDGERTALYRANLHLRTANRILVRLGEFPAVGFAELRKRAAHLPWERCLAPGQPVSLRVTCHKSRLYHSDAVAERVAGAIADRLGRPSNITKYDEEEAGTPPQLIVVRLLHDLCTISIDSSGELLHRRGYRLATAKAPLRETLAATMLLASGWASGAGKETSDPPAALMDPFCGSGTIAIEAAQMALGMAAGMASGGARRFAFMAWPDFDAPLWGQLVEQAEEHHARQLSRQSRHLQIAASDRDAGAVELARANAARGGVADQIEFSRQGVSAVVPCCERGWIVTNPPYGLRVSAGHDVRNLYAQFGHVLRTSFSGWQFAVLCNERQLLAQIGLPMEQSLNLVNGGLPVVFGRGSVEPPR